MSLFCLSWPLLCVAVRCFALLVFACYCVALHCWSLTQSLPTGATPMRGVQLTPGPLTQSLPTCNRQTECSPQVPLHLYVQVWGSASWGIVESVCRTFIPHGHAHADRTQLSGPKLPKAKSPRVQILQHVRQTFASSDFGLQ